MTEKPRRKTTTSTEVKQRWIKANYKSYHVNLRYDRDQQLIDYIESHITDGEGVTDVIRKALKYYAEKHPY